MFLRGSSSAGALCRMLFPATFIRLLTVHVPARRLAALLGNMLFLWVFGRNVEDLIGSGRFVCFTLCAGLLRAIVQVMASPYSRIPTIGASGAIAGVMGAYLIKFPRARIVTLVLDHHFHHHDGNSGGADAGVVVRDPTGKRVRIAGRGGLHGRRRGIFRAYRRVYRRHAADSRLSSGRAALAKLAGRRLALRGRGKVLFSGYVHSETYILNCIPLAGRAC